MGSRVFGRVVLDVQCKLAVAVRDAQGRGERYPGVVARHLEEAGAQVVLGFIDALEGAFRQIADHPDSGSPRHGRELNLPGLRSWPVKAHPHVVFHMTADGLVDVWRVLHGRRDIPARLRER